MASVREQLTTQVLALLEASADVSALFRAANKGNLLDQPGWLRESVAKLPADFRRFMLDFPRGSHSMYAKSDGTSFAADDPSFHTMTDIDFDVGRLFVLSITIRDLLPESGVISAPEEPIISALFKAGSRLGLPDIVERIGEATYERRETRKGERPSPGTITIIRLPIVTLESGRTLLAS